MELKDILLVIAGNAIVILGGVAAIAALIRRIPQEFGAKLSSEGRKLFGTEVWEKIEDEVIEPPLKKFIEGLDQDDAE